MIAVVGGGGFVGRNMMTALGAKAFCIEYGEPLDFQDADTVIHLAANADVRKGWDEPFRDLRRNTIFTARLLEHMRRQGVRRLLFASSSSVYGDAPVPTPETYFGQQTSLYGASKLACEGLIGAYAAAGHISATVLRLTSMLGPHYRHGLVADFVDQYRRLKLVTVLGGGQVARTRCHVSDGVNAFLGRLDADPGYEVFNVGTCETVTSYEVALQVVETLGGTARDIEVVGESWVGDHPILLDCSKLRATGWEPKWLIPEAISDTVSWLTS
jgi:UDP-glucose 4-epimerase